MRRIFIALLLSGLVGCANTPSTTSNLVTEGELLTFLEQPPGAKEQAVMRYFVTPDYLRIEREDGAGGRQFQLFDRQRQQLYLVNNAGKEIVQFAQGAKSFKEMNLSWRHQADKSMALPRTTGESLGMEASHYSYSLGQHSCLDVVAVPGMLEMSASALAEYRRYLAQYRQTTPPVLTDEKQQACFQAVFVSQPQKSFEQGFPLREWSVAGNHRFLLDAKQTVRFEPQLFTLPASYYRRSAGLDDHPW